ncbi:hypothetical protein AB3S75_014646 [Citrus x aurantiifolia]
MQRSPKIPAPVITGHLVPYRRIHCVHSLLRILLDFIVALFFYCHATTFLHRKDDISGCYLSFDGAYGED